MAIRADAIWDELADGANTINVLVGLPPMPTVVR